MYTLTHQVEFLGDAWLDRVRSYLSREVEQRRDRLGGAFSVSECFTDAPPHMALPADVASWTMRWDGTGVTVERGFDAAADVVVEGDYQAALTCAQYVGMSVPGGADAMFRELANVYGKDAIRMKGRLPTAAAGVLMGDLHDHMGRITVENPDLHHRAARQGVLGHIREMEEHGFTVLERAISTDFADEIRDQTLRALTNHNATSLQWMLYHGRCFELLAQHPTFMTLIDASLGRGAVIASLSAIRKSPGPGFIPLHTDYSHVPEPYPEWAMTGVGVWSFEDWTEASGPTWVVPGSHRMRRSPRPGEEVTGGIPVEMPKGSVVFFTEGLWHWQGDRTEPGERVTLHWHYNRGILRSLEPKKSDEQLLHRNSPRLGEMLGLDDWFDKMRGIGRDHERFAHMRQLHTFTDRQKRLILAGE